jgi:hypothetical protein
LVVDESSCCFFETVCHEANEGSGNFFVGPKIYNTNDFSDLRLDATRQASQAAITDLQAAFRSDRVKAPVAAAKGLSDLQPYGRYSETML